MQLETATEQKIQLEKLTKLEKKWYAEYLKCFNSTDALRRAYPDNQYTGESIKSIAYQTKKSVFTKLHLTDFDLMQLMGLTDEHLLDITKEGLKATKPIVVGNKVQGVPDYSTRHKYLETTLKLTGKLSDKTKIELTGENGGPLKIEMLAGIGFLNQPNPEKDEIR